MLCCFILYIYIKLCKHVPWLVGQYTKKQILVNQTTNNILTLYISRVLFQARNRLFDMKPSISSYTISNTHSD